jgi:hypothetical protein
MKKILLTLFVLVASLLAGQQLLPASAAAATDQNVCNGIKATGATTCTGGDTQITSIIRTLIKLLSFIVGIAAVIMIIIGGLKYITSGGDSSSTASAKNTILYAIVGLVIAAAAQFLVQFILGKAK